MLIYRASILPNLEGLYAVIVKLYGNSRHVQFLVCDPPNLALTRATTDKLPARYL